MKNQEFVPDGYCGLYCAACPQYMGTKNNQIDVTDENACKGCKSDTVAKGWYIKCNLKACAKTKNVEFCYECSEYPCENLKTFKQDPDYPYHSEVFDYMNTIKTSGKEAWLQDMESRWKCTQCGSSFNWWTTKCEQCGNAVKGYSAPR